VIEPSTILLLELPLNTLGSPWKAQIKDPTAFWAVKAIEIDCPTLKIKFLGYSMANPILVLVA
jgi:hypothetical protein